MLTDEHYDAVRYALGILWAVTPRLEAIGRGMPISEEDKVFLAEHLATLEQQVSTIRPYFDPTTREAFLRQSPIV